MTEITFQKTKNGQVRYFSCVGHAGFGGFGKDIVCAALSMLTINTVNSLEEIAKQELDVESDEKRGQISCGLVGEINEVSDILLRSYELGVTAISEQYGEKYCKVRIKEV